ncbi:MAG: UvrD-helicase domain-containing protein [Muribaculaceae bacterium]|nr:UvrD-helicase domain-containing protein [Muribaculaceae bacterium]
MLDLHRASAGSGKTYTLAKKYIWYLITVSVEGSPRRLRTDAELAESARHILAVTFTNKATGEMQQRIVDKLFELAVRQPEWATAPDGTARIKSPDYMDDFVNGLKVGPERVAAVCRKALALLLENYSDFKVSTIDSFFQLVLRTFAYESDLNDTYQVELDSEFLSQVGVDGALEEIDASPDDRNTPYWIRQLMDRADAKWNIFTRQYSGSSSFSNAVNPYEDFVKSVNRLENEEYKLIRDEMERYFAGNPDFIALYEDLAARYESPVRDAFMALRKECRAIRALLPADMLTASSRTDVGKFVSRVKKIADAPAREWKREPDTRLSEFIAPSYLEKNKMAEALAAAGENSERIRLSVEKAASALSRFIAEWSSPDYRHWRLYAVNLPYLALFSIVERKRREYLQDTNSVELGETSMILRSVIGDSDAPFIYERLGTYLDHFLIDEFQDTSRLQWENLRPLLEESMSRDNDNLIIGDAKQSIYRFRNADPSLITTVVPEQFGDSVRTLGDRPEENTNYRSLPGIVRFNNSFFSYLVSRLDREAVLEPDRRRMFGPLYANVAQTPFKKDTGGYVEVILPGRDQADFNGYVAARVPEMVAGLCARGYRQRDIAVLVGTGLEGESIIRAFVEYNARTEDPAAEIRFVSEQSLKIAASPAVRIVLGVLENMARGFNPEINPEEERLRKGVGNWTEMESGFKFYSMGRQDMTMAELLDSFLAERPDMGAVTDMLDSLQSLAIPALVEAVVARFVPDDVRRENAVYLAAFQDIVLEYCDSHPTDLGSFLKWWERKSLSASISSPEDTDAVQVLTIHKSKGLEYDCVIIPFAKWNMADHLSPRKKEWRWVRPEMISHPAMELPPYIPVETSSMLETTSHCGLLYGYYDMVRMDSLNSAYVGFTRAGRELYIFCPAKGVAPEIEPAPAKKGKKVKDLSDGGAEYFEMGRYLADFLTGLGERPEDESIAPDARLDAETVGFASRVSDSEPFVIRAGERVEDIRAMREESLRRKEMNATGNRPRQSDALPAKEPDLIDDYFSSVPQGDELRYCQGDVAEIINAADVPEDGVEDLDPRSEGNIKHAVLARVKVPADLHASVRHLALAGLMTPQLARQIEDDLAGQLARPTVARWFDGTARVINERPILKAGQVSRRPDRILVYPDGHAEVVDYKFGKYDRSGKYRRQIAGYVRRLAATGMYTDVKGYLWYVNEDVIELV